MFFHVRDCDLTHVPAQGIYYTRETFVVAKPDGRVKEGWTSRKGIPQGAWIQVVPYGGASDDPALLCVKLGGYEELTIVMGTNPDVSPRQDPEYYARHVADVNRFLALLDPSTELDDAVYLATGGSNYTTAMAGGLLTQLVQDGVLTLDQIREGSAKVRAREEAEDVKNDG